MHFPDMAQQAFSFLEDAGFRLVQRDSCQLQYETAQVLVTVEWDARSGETTVFFGLQPRKGAPRDGFSLGDLLAMQGVYAPERKMPFQVAEESRLSDVLQKVAADIRKYAQPALAGDRMFSHRLKAVQECAVPSIHARHGAPKSTLRSRQSLAQTRTRSGDPLIRFN